MAPVATARTAYWVDHAVRSVSLPTLLLILNILFHMMWPAKISSEPFLLRLLYVCFDMAPISYSRKEIREDNKTTRLNTYRPHGHTATQPHANFPDLV